jgi:hypothetical protein
VTIRSLLHATSDIASVVADAAEFCILILHSPGVVRGQ